MYISESGGRCSWWYNELIFPQFGRPLAGARSAVMGRIGLPELVVILFIVILIFGANRLPDIMGGIGKGIRNFKDATRDDKPSSPNKDKS